MPENFHERESWSERERPLRPADQKGPISDREVPVTPVATPDVINRWLDGELPEPTGLRGDAARSVEFWRRLGEETDNRRRMQTPAHLSAKIMAALPPLATAQPAVTPWFRRDVRLNTMMAVGAGAAIFALGIAVARLLG